MKQSLMLLLCLSMGKFAISQNPVLLKDVYPGFTGSGIQQIVKTNNYSFFNAEDDDPDADRGLYRTDGTVSGTVKLNLTSTGYNSTKAEKLTSIGDKIIFAGDNLSGYGEIWVSDGTQAGTFGIERFQPAGRVPVIEIGRLGNQALYSVVENDGTTSLKKTDGTIAGTSVIYRFTGFATASQPVFFKEINGVCYFIVYDGNGTGYDHLWRTDGTAAGTYQLYGFGATQYIAGYIMPAGNNFYMMLVTPGVGNVLWKSDGTIPGTVPVKTIGTSGNNNYPANIFYNNIFYFAGIDGNGMELWKSDGTQAGTSIVSDIYPGSASSNPSNLTIFNNAIYFSGSQNPGGSKLLKYDGSSVSLVKDVDVAFTPNGLSSFSIAGDKMLFPGTTLASGQELWITDGTTANTILAAEIRPGATGSGVSFLTGGNPSLLVANNGITGAEIFSYNKDFPSTVTQYNAWYVNDNSTNGDVYTTAAGNNSNPGNSSAPFQTIAHAVSVAQAGDTIFVDAGLYFENAVINKQLTLKGKYAGNAPGDLLDRGNETIVTTSGTDAIFGIIFNVSVPGVTIDGFTFNGNNPFTSGGISVNGEDVNVGQCILNQNQLVHSLAIRNNIIRNFTRYGIFVSRNTNTDVINGIIIDNNRLDNISGNSGRGIGLFNNVYGNVTNNRLTRISTGIILANSQLANAGTQSVSNNIIQSYIAGIQYASNFGNAATWSITNNQVSTADYSNWVAPNSNQVVNQNTGIIVAGIGDAARVTLSQNNISDANNGISVSNLVNNLGTQSTKGVTITGGTISNSKNIGILVSAGGFTNEKLRVVNTVIQNSLSANIVATHSTGSALPLEFSGVTVSGGPVGLAMSGSVSIPSNNLTGISFTNQSHSFIALQRKAFYTQELNISNVSFDGITANQMSLGQRLTLADKLKDRIDYDSVGLLRMKAGEIQVTVNSFWHDVNPAFGLPTTSADINRAVNAAVAGDSIQVGPGNFVNQVTINKSLTLAGAGSDQTFLIQPTTLINAPEFTEKGLVQSARNIGAVHVKGLNITGDYTVQLQSVFLQTGGSVKNCILNNGNQGIFFRTEDAVTTATVENNIINAQFIGVNIAGTGVTGIVSNNSITAVNGGYSAGIFAGVGGGPLPDFSATNNSIGGYKNLGILLNANNSTINQNSIVGVAGKAIEGNTSNATCNWFGSNDASVIASKMTGNVSFSPWLINGIDSEPLVTGFQSTAPCTGMQRVYYVNDASTTGDLLTTATGNDANPGYPNAPLLTLTYAISKAQPGDTIIVDAGTYAENITIDKTLVLKGCQSGVSPGTLLSRGSESIIVPSATNTASGNLVIARSANTVIDGFTLDGDNPLLTGGVILNGVDVNTSIAILNTQQPSNNLWIKHNIIKNFTRLGVLIQAASTDSIQGVTIEYNLIDNLSSGSQSGRAIAFLNNVFGQIQHNIIRRTVTGININNTTRANNTASNIFHNDIQTYVIGIIMGSNVSPNCEWLIKSNTLATADLSTWASPGSNTSVNNNTGIQITNFRENMKLTIDGNLITGVNTGIGTASVLNSTGISIKNNVVIGASFYGMLLQGNVTAGNPPLTLDNNFLNNNKYGIYLYALGNMPISFQNTLINGGEAGLVISGPVQFPANTLSGISFNNQSVSHIQMMRKALKDQQLIATSVKFNGLTGNEMSLTERFATADKIRDRVDYDSVGLVKFKQGEVHITPASFTGSIPSDEGIRTDSAKINRAIEGGVSADTVYVAPGTYYGKVVVTKSLTLRGAHYGFNPGSSLDRANESILMPDFNATNLTDYILKPAANSVTIDGFTINGDNPAITGSLVLNGTDINAGSGIYNDNAVINNLTVINNIVKNTGSYGIGQFKIFGASTGSPVYNTLIKNNRVDNIGSRGIVLAYNAYGTITENEISRTNNGIWYANSTLAHPLSLPLVISKNKLTAITSSGIQSNANSGQSARVEILENEVSGSGSFGISVVNNSTGFQVKNNSIIGSQAGFYSNLPYSNIPYSITNNSISGYGSYALQSTVILLTATCNWLGYSAAQDIAPKVTGFNYTPWLSNSTDADAATGFQPMAGSCNGTLPAIALAKTDITCFGLNNGTIDATITGGVSPFIYNWTRDLDPSFNASTQDLNSLEPGNYSLLVTDANGTTATDEININEPEQLIATVSGINNICYGGTIGSASVVINGGTIPYSILWNTGATGYEIEDLPAGVYTATVTDVKGCIASASYEVTQPTEIILTMTNLSTACSNIAKIAASGGTGSYSYVWSNGSTSDTLSNVSTGTYTVTVTDENNCTKTASITLTTNEAFNPSAAVTHALCAGTATGTITVTNVNGQAPFVYKLNNEPAQSTPSFSGLAAGTYTITVIDANGCTGFVSKTINDPLPIVVTTELPVPTCSGIASGSVNSSATGGTGSLSFSWTGPNGFTSTQKNISNLFPGEYILTVTDINGCSAVKTVTISSSPAITLNYTPNNISCKGGSNGSISGSASGGSGSGFSYLWNTGQTIPSLANLGTGNYSLTVTDAGTGCTAQQSFVITQPSLAVNVSFTKTNATGCSTLGTISATGSGGTGPYEYWLNNSTPQTSGNFSGLSGGNYTLWVRDSKGCSISKPVSITDNGSDQWEGNNSKNQAKPISVGTPISARIALSTDVADWFRFVAVSGTGGIHTITLNHTLAYNIQLFSASGTSAITSQSGSGNSKTYSLTAGATYYVSITGPLSFNCYSLAVVAGSLNTTRNENQAEEIIEADVEEISAKAYPNPHQGEVSIKINSPANGNGVLELFNASGQKLQRKNIQLIKGEGNIIRLTNVTKGISVYRITLGKHVVSGKLTGL